MACKQHEQLLAACCCVAFNSNSWTFIVIFSCALWGVGYKRIFFARDHSILDACEVPRADDVHKQSLV